MGGTEKSLKPQTIIKILLLILSYVFVVAVISNNFDFDLGWHLRFGKEFWESGKFSYVDTYTYSHFGQYWVNHEWGGDLLTWPLYRSFGYNALLLIYALLPLIAFTAAVRIFNKKITIGAAAIILWLIWSSQHILIVRLHMFTPLFLAIIWYCLERLPRQKNYYLWPIIMGLWSMLHGSWILGFIVMGIYGVGNIINLLCKKYYIRFYQEKCWSKREIYLTAIWGSISALVICLNPYTINIWREVLSYFTNSYYKLHSIEWLPSYYPPVYWVPLLLAFFTLPLAAFAFKKHRLTWPQLLLYLAFWWSAWQYKRNALLFLIICAPLLIGYWDEIQNYLRTKPNIKELIRDKILFFSSAIFSIATILLLIAYYLVNINFTTDVWSDKKIMRQAYMPVAAVEFIKQDNHHPLHIFNDFAWGGYLNWTLPNDLIFLDGRGTATWKTPAGMSYLEYYRDLNFKAGGLTQIEKQPVNYILLAKFTSLPKPKKINQLVNFESNVGLGLERRQLVDDLQNSSNWMLVFEDKISWLWEKKQ